MHIKAFTLTFAALLAGASAVPVQPVSNDAMAARTAVREESLSKIRAVNLDKRDCPTNDQGQQVCETCFIFGDDECCTVTNMVTGETLSDACTYFGGGKA